MNIKIVSLIWESKGHVLWLKGCGSMRILCILWLRLVFYLVWRSNICYIWGFWLSLGVFLSPSLWILYSMREHHNVDHWYELQTPCIITRWKSRQITLWGRHFFTHDQLYISHMKTEKSGMWSINPMVGFTVIWVKFQLN